MSNIERFGIFGGTFNPPHNGHVRAARLFFEKMKLDRLLIIPDYVPPHKKLSDCDDPIIRLEMAEAAFGSLSDKICVSDYEIKKTGVSYTVDTLRHFSRPGRELYLLCGTDMFISLDTWREPETIFALSQIVCINRVDYSSDITEEKANEFRKRFGAIIHLLDMPPLVLSSSDVRDMIGNYASADEYIPEGVQKIIEREQLYK